MENYAKTILTCYDTIDGYITQIENLVRIKAKNSFYFRNGTIGLAEQLISLSEIRKDLMELSEIVDKMLKKMTEEDKILISYKYFGVQPEDKDFDLTSRNYFRKQVRAIKRFAELLKKSGFDLFVDGTPCDLGRDVKLLKAVSENSNVKIVASTGFYHFPNLFTINRTSLELASWILKEFEKGMEGTSILPGILKCASNNSKLSYDEKISIGAMAIVQNKTGLPLYVHCSHTENVEEKLSFLVENGANIEKIIVGHCGLKPNVKYLAHFLNKGCYISMDQNHCSSQKEEIPNTLYELCKMGYSNKILLSSDYCIYTDFSNDAHKGFEKDIDAHLYKLNYQINEILTKFKGNTQDFYKMMGENIFNVLDV